MKCLHCGKDFESIYSYQKFCSQQCRVAFQHKQRAKQRIIKVCARCGKQFETGYVTQKFCSEQCRYFHRRGKRYAKKTTAPPPPKKSLAQLAQEAFARGLTYGQYRVLIDRSVFNENPV